MRSLIRLALISLVSTVLVAAYQGRDEGQSTISVNVDMVVLNATVTDGKGRQVTGLKRSDFHVQEAGRPQEIKVFHAEGEPASLGLIIDNSGSMENKHVDAVRAAVAFVAASDPQNEIFILTFNETVHLEFTGLGPSSWTPDRLRATLLARTPAGLTALYDAVAMGLDRLTASTLERRALVVLSDGGDNASRRSLENVVQTAQRSSATIYAIGIYDTDNMDRNPGALKKLAALTGGQAHFPTEPKDLDKVLRKIGDSIRSQYMLGYVSSDTRRNGEFRKVKVAASSPEGKPFKVLTREGYIAPADDSIRR